MIAVLLAFAACAVGQDKIMGGPELPPILYRAVMQSPGGELPFEFRRNRETFDSGTTVLINGSEQIGPFECGNGVIWLPDYDSDLHFPDGFGKESSKGTWTKRTGNNQSLEMQVVIEKHPGYRFKPYMKVTMEIVPDFPIAGRWAVKFADDKEPAVGIFKTGENKTVEGTFLTTTGDYRYLAGSYEHGLLRLSCFDGAHAFLFHANMQSDGTLKGDFWSGPKYHDTWTAKRDDRAALPDGFTLTRVNPKARLKDLKFPDLSGKVRSLGDDGLLGKATIIEIFGSWCPNCHDAANLLVALEKKYNERGFKVVGLAFESNGETEHDARQVKRYLNRHYATYPVLLAGVRDKAKASAALPVIDGLKGYPTFLFVDAAGEVRSVYTGFSGPATGEEYTKLRGQFESTIERLLSR